MYYVYVVQSLAKDWHYIGITNDVNKRLLAHNAGKTKSTKPHRPFKLIYTEASPSRIEARKREVYLKANAKAREQIYKALSSNG